jgi:LTXXQ motif family protein
MKHTTVFAIAIATVASLAAIGLGQPTAFAQEQTDKSPDMGMGGMEHGMMGADKNEGMKGPGMGGGMMGKGGMMGMMGGGCPMMGMMMGGGGEMPMYREGRIAFLKAELAIADVQTTAWDAYAEALKKNMQSMQDMHKTMMAARAGKSAVERLDAHVTAMESRLQALKDIKPALTALYGTLSDDQKKKADELLTGMGCMM